MLRKFCEKNAFVQKCDELQDLTAPILKPSVNMRDDDFKFEENV
jgi:hypothetical protein